MKKYSFLFLAFLFSASIAGAENLSCPMAKKFFAKFDLPVDCQPYYYDPCMIPQLKRFQADYKGMSKAERKSFKKQFTSLYASLWFAFSKEVDNHRGDAANLIYDLGNGAKMTKWLWDRRVFAPEPKVQVLHTELPGLGHRVGLILQVEYVKNESKVDTYAAKSLETFQNTNSDLAEKLKSGAVIGPWNETQSEFIQCAKPVSLKNLVW